MILKADCCMLLRFVATIAVVARAGAWAWAAVGSINRSGVGVGDAIKCGEECRPPRLAMFARGSHGMETQ